MFNPKSCSPPFPSNTQQCQRRPGGTSLSRRSTKSAGTSGFWKSPKRPQDCSTATWSVNVLRTGLDCPRCRPFAGKIQPPSFRQPRWCVYAARSLTSRRWAQSSGLCLSPRSLASLLMFRTSQLMQGTVGGNLQMASTAEVQRAVFLCVDE